MNAQKKTVVTKEQISGGKLFEKPRPLLTGVDVIKNRQLRVIQNFSGVQFPVYTRHGKKPIPGKFVDLSPPCDVLDCDNKAVVMLATEDNKGWCLCLEHINQLGDICGEKY